jgi:hypothetical protein
MNASSTRLADVSVESALARVLEAEALARDAVAAAQAEAARIAEQSRADARALAERSRLRIERGRGRIARQVQRTLAETRAQSRDLAGPAQPDATAQQRLQRAVTALAAELTGGAAARP